MQDIPVSLIAAPVFFVEMPSGKIRSPNPAAQQGWGYPRPRFERLCLTDLFASSDADIYEALCDAAANRAPRAFSADVITGQGVRRRHRFLAQPVGPGANCLVLVGVDVTEEHSYEESLETDARRLRALIESNFDAYYDWRMTRGEYHEWSPQMEELLGLDPGTFPNSLEAWIERLHPSEREAVTTRLKASVEQGGPYHDEYLLRREDGEYRLVSDRGVLLFNDNGTPTDLVGVIRDITQERAARLALEESEELYRTLFQAANNPALRTDDQGRCIDGNEAALSFLGMSKEDLLRTSIADHFGHRALEVLQDLSQAPLSDHAAMTVELAVGRGDEERALVMSVIPCPVSGHLTHFWLGTEVTRLRRLNAALEESQDSLKAQARALEERSVALRVILEQGRQERLDLERAIQDNIDRLVTPMLDRLQHFLANRPEASYVEAARETLGEIARPLGYAESGGVVPVQASLTRKELEVARLVQMDKSTDEIASILHVSPATVSYHRKRIRRKLGLKSRRIRLAAYLRDLKGGQRERREMGGAIPGDRPLQPVHDSQSDVSV